MKQLKRVLHHLLLACFVVAVALVASLAMLVALAKECIPSRTRGIGQRPGHRAGSQPAATGSGSSVA